MGAKLSGKIMQFDFLYSFLFKRKPINVKMEAIIHR